MSLVTQLTNTYPNAASRCLLDLLNEPDAFKLQWQAQSGLPGVGDLYLRAMDAIYPVNQGIVVYIDSDISKRQKTDINIQKKELTALLMRSLQLEARYLCQLQLANGLTPMLLRESLLLRGLHNRPLCSRA